jgi:hypothetical protein
MITVGLVTSQRNLDCSSDSVVLSGVLISVVWTNLGICIFNRSGKRESTTFHFVIHCRLAY